MKSKFLFCLLIGFLLCSPGETATISYYRFEGSGNILDDTVGTGDGTHTATYSTNVPESTVPLTGDSNIKSLSLQGTASGIVHNSPFILHNQYGNATLEFWIKAPEQTHRAIFWTRDGDDDRNRFNITINPGGGWHADYRDPNGTWHGLLNQEISITANTWTHLAIVREVISPTQHRYLFYKNGVLGHTAIDNSPYLPNVTSWSIARRTSLEMQGQLDEIRFSDVALNSNQFLYAVPEPSVSLLFVMGILIVFLKKKCIL